MKVPVVVGAIACMALALVGCGGSSSADSDEPIEVFGPYRTAEADRFREVLADFSETSGIPVRYVGTAGFVDDLRRRVGEDSDPPDVAVVPQPGLVAEFARTGRIVPVSAATADEVTSNYPPGPAKFGRVGGTLYGVPFRITVKSLVWYRPQVFAENGWKPPRSLSELDELVEAIRARGMTPWCFTMGAGGSTGWAATDWSEDLVARRAGLEAYRGWAEGRIAFRDPRIASAFEYFEDLVLARGNVDGGVRSVVSTPVDQMMQPLLDDPPGCAMAKAPDFAASWLPDTTTIGEDGDIAWFVLPGLEATAEAPLVVGGDQFVQFRRSADIDALMTYLAGPDAGQSWVQYGGFLSPKATIRPEDYPDGHLLRLVDRVQESQALAFDASDVMPPDVGSGLLWDEITLWVAGASSYTRFATSVDLGLTTQE